MSTVNAGRAMPDALYIKDGKYIPIKAVHVNPNSKKKKTFYCTFCKRKVVHSKGNKNEGSKPFFRKAPTIDHVEGCDYGKKKNLKEIEREIGTLENLHYGIKPPLIVQATEVGGTSNNSSGEKGARRETKGTRIKINPTKRHSKNILTVDDLFHEIMDIKSQEQPIKSNLFSRIFGVIYYSYSQYDLLIKHYEDNKFEKKKYFFIAGKINVNQYKNLALDEGYAELEGVNEGIKLHIYPFNDEISKGLKRITWKTREAKKSEEFIGLKASIKGVIQNDRISIIKLNVYEFDLNHYSNF